MKKVIFLLSILLLTWCALDNKKWVVEENVSDVSVISWEQDSPIIDPYPSYNDGGALLSWEFSWSGKYSTLLLSGWILNYDNIFTLQINGNDYNHWDYSASQNLLSWTYKEAWYINSINQQRHNTINIEKPVSSWSYVVGASASNEEKCSVFSDEWWLVTKKPIRYENNGQIYYAIEEEFRWIQINNYQITLCFVKDDIVYHVVIGNSDGYKNDIKNSLRFL